MSLKMRILDKRDMKTVLFDTETLKDFDLEQLFVLRDQIIRQIDDRITHKIQKSETEIAELKRIREESDIKAIDKNTEDITELKERVK